MIEIRILSPQGTIYDGKVSHVRFPGEAGAFAVYPSHAPIISTLVKGNIVCFPEGGEKQTFPIRNGFAEIKNDRATVCVEAEPAPGKVEQ
ncbi:MAG: F0F1 ATP synthase subunit epsilon [Tannerella sp.]|jgi:F-type H+-transporting ATPase subunit epsilon|nr:F0F1 ATP synthase subunit epsilon [Tannerella sp.]